MDYIMQTVILRLYLVYLIIQQIFAIYRNFEDKSIPADLMFI